MDLSTFRRAGMRIFVFICIACSLISALNDVRYDPKIFIAYAICVVMLLWRTEIYAWIMLLTLLLASLNILRMFSVYEEWSMVMSLNKHNAGSPTIDPRAVLFLVVYILFSYPVLKKGFVHFLNSGEDKP